ncbi:MAG: MFS transporter [Candidatus Nanopelagicales bacterium]|nr:MFS transporter [Candidatus Nanopelagicales bacterium]
MPLYTPRAAASPAPIARRRDVLFASAGAVMEWYDFMLFAYLAPVFAKVFFPGSAGPTALLETLAIFAAGFLMGPVGSFYFGSKGDRKGRKWVLTVTVGMMIFPMMATSMLPGYATIGIAAPILLLIMRLIQGFAVGGQYGGVMVVMIESASAGRRGRVASYATMTSGVGVLLAACVAASLTYLSTPAGLESWAWRIAYVFGAILTIIVFILRTKMSETESFSAMRRSGTLSPAPIRDTFRFQWRPLVKTVAISGYANVVYYMIASYIPTYLTVVYGFQSTESLVIVSIFSAIFAISAPLWGSLTDRVGRKRPLAISVGFIILISVPCFAAFSTGSSGWTYLSVIALSLPLMAIWGSYGALGPEMFPAKFRSTGTTISYNIGNSVFGGTVPFAATALIAITGWNWSPALILLVGSLLMIPVLRHTRETAFCDLAALDASAPANKPGPSEMTAEPRA